MAVRTSDFKFGREKWIVSPFLTDGATHTTIAAAIAAASYGDSIFVRPGTYIENLTLKNGVTIVADEGPGLIGVVEIVGKCTATDGARHVFSGIRLTTNSDNLLLVSGTSQTRVIFVDCFLFAADNTAISFTNSSASSSILLNKCSGSIGGAGIAYFASTSAGNIVFNHCVMNGNAASTTPSTISAGSVRIYNSTFSESIQTTGTGAIWAKNTFFNPQNTPSFVIDHQGTSTLDEANRLDFCRFRASTDTSPCINVGAGATLGLNNCSVSSSNGTAAIQGAGTVVYSSLSFTNQSAITTTTKTGNIFRPGIIRNDLQPAFLCSVNGNQDDVTGDATTYTIPFATEIFDKASNFSSTTFTAPYTGKYLLTALINFHDTTSSHTLFNLNIVTSNRSYKIGNGNPFNIMDVSTFLASGGSVIADMDAADTATVTLQVSNGTKVIDVGGSAGQNFSYFSGEFLG